MFDCDANLHPLNSTMLAHDEQPPRRKIGTAAAAKRNPSSPPAGRAIWGLSVATLLLAIVPLKNVACQDLLRNQNFRPTATPSNNFARSQQQANFNQQLANIQLPPQLASLTPQQLHQLAQIREFQLQQEADQNARRQQQQQAASMAAASEFDNGSQTAPAPLGLENAAAAAPSLPRPTAQPAAPASPGQIPQPNTAAAAAASEENDRHDDGAYTESGSEMEGVSASSGTQETSRDTTRNSNANQQSTAPASNAPAAASSPTFEVNWNKCPQLEPSESEKNKKTQVITKCLQSAPIPTNLTHESVEAHRKQIATCALKVEGWFDDQGGYRFDKAENEIRGKKLDGPIELQVLKFHVACKDEANKKFPRQQNKLIDQVQFYQACMDYYISIVCEIEVSVDQ